ncbi:Holliday junction branch migration protein RuvA [Croceiramulus getboli]|nr:Holliday junction branch migration protein RuvA [Flavobacteriaceae bacterium YJPT1-3]
MISHLKGRLVEKTPTHVIIECGGVGYFVNISLHTFDQIPDEESIQLLTHFQVKEDSHTLYGFVQASERELFRLLLSVSGIGPNTARTMLSSLRPEEIHQAIASGDDVTIQSIKGIGAKTAKRVIIDLKDKVLKLSGMDEVSAGPRNTSKEEALSALETLGFARKQAEKVCDKILREHPNATVELLIKEALKNL